METSAKYFGLAVGL